MLNEEEQQMALLTLQHEQRVQKENLIQLKANLVKGIFGAEGFHPDEEALKKLEKTIRQRREEAKYDEEILLAEQKLAREKKAMEDLKVHMEKIKQKKATG